MKKTCVVASTWVHRAVHRAFAAAAGLMLCSAAYAVSFGHSHMTSAPGQPLGIDVAVVGLSPAEATSLRVQAAPIAAWRAAGLMPPVDPATMSFRVVPGILDDTRVVQVRSTQTFDGPVADLLLQVNTASGQQQHQVSVVTRAGEVQPPASGSTARAGSGASNAVQYRRPIRVQHGDTLFAIARRNAVQGVTVYQMLVALQRANPKAFLHDNMNLVRAGATLQFPDWATLTAVSDAEARRIFVRQAQAFAQYRQRLAAQRAGLAQAGSAEQGSVTASSSGQSAVMPSPQPQDQLVLSNPAQEDDDQKAATSKNIRESEQRVSQLEENVKSLNEALRAQGGAAASAVVEGVTSLGESLSEVAESLVPTTSESPSVSEVTTSEPSSGVSSQPRDQSSDMGLAPSTRIAAPEAAASPPGTSGAGALPSLAPSAGTSSDRKSIPSVRGLDVEKGVVDQRPVEGELSAAEDAGSAPARGNAEHQALAPTAGGPGTQQSASPAASISAETASPSTGPSGSGSAAASKESAAGKAPSTLSAESQSVSPLSIAENNTGAASLRESSDDQVPMRPVQPSGTDTARADNTASIDSNAISGSTATQAGGATAPAAGSQADHTSVQNAAAPAPSLDGTHDSTAAPAGSIKPSVDSRESNQFVSWFQEYSLGIITAALALIVLLIAWVLRRANTRRDDQVVTPAMVKEKLGTIDLDLRQPPTDPRPGQS